MSYFPLYYSTPTNRLLTMTEAWFQAGKKKDSKLWEKTRGELGSRIAALVCSTPFGIISAAYHTTATIAKLPITPVYTVFKFTLGYLPWINAKIGKNGWEKADLSFSLTTLLKHVLRVVGFVFSAFLSPLVGAIHPHFNYSLHESLGLMVSTQKITTKPEQVNPTVPQPPLSQNPEPSNLDIPLPPPLPSNPPPLPPRNLTPAVPPVAPPLPPENQAAVVPSGASKVTVQTTITSSILVYQRGRLNKAKIATEKKSDSLSDVLAKRRKAYGSYNIADSDEDSATLTSSQTVLTGNLSANNTDVKPQSDADLSPKSADLSPKQRKKPFNPDKLKIKPQAGIKALIVQAGLT